MELIDFKNVLENKILTKSGGLNAVWLKDDHFKIKNELPEWYSYVLEQAKELGTDNVNEAITCLYKDIKEIPKCPICGGRLRFLHFKISYKETCSIRCGKLLKGTDYNSFIKKLNKTKNNILESVNNWLDNPIESNIETYSTFTNEFSLTKVPKHRNQFYYLLWNTKEIIPLPNNITQLSDLKLPLRQYHYLNHLNEIPKCIYCDNDANFYNSVKGYSPTCKSFECERERNRETRRKTTQGKLFDNLIGYSVVESYKDRYTPIKVKHDECGHEFYYNCWNGSHVSHVYLCPNCHKTSSQEEEISSFLTELGIEHITSDRQVLDKLELDIYVPDKKLAIEFNGMYWHSESVGKDKNYHLNKTTLCEEKGIQLLHIFSCEWNTKRDIVKSIISSKLGVYKHKYYARKCVVKEIDTKTKNQFLNENHLQGEDKSKTKLGLFYNDELVSVMTFGKRLLGRGKSKLELLRFCNKLNATVVGGASKLIKYYVTNYDVEDEVLYSYCDRRYSVGGFYEKLGFEYSHSSNPSYYYFRNDNEMINRNRMMKHKMINILETFDPSLTEVENAKANKYNRIWDCGTHVYKYNLK